MIIICPSCDARYNLPQAIAPPGRKVRCRKCTHVWWAEAPTETEPVASALPDAASPFQIGQDTPAGQSWPPATVQAHSAHSSQHHGTNNPNGLSQALATAASSERGPAFSGHNTDALAEMSWPEPPPVPQTDGSGEWAPPPSWPDPRAPQPADGRQYERLSNVADQQTAHEAPWAFEGSLQAPPAPFQPATTGAAGTAMGAPSSAQPMAPASGPTAGRSRGTPPDNTAAGADTANMAAGGWSPWPEPIATTGGPAPRRGDEQSFSPVAPPVQRGFPGAAMPSLGQAQAQAQAQAQGQAQGQAWQDHNRALPTPPRPMPGPHTGYPTLQPPAGGPPALANPRVALPEVQQEPIRPPARRKRSWASIAASLLIILSTIGLIAFLAVERNLVARTVPGAAGLYAALGMPANPHGLALRNIKVDWVEEDNQTELEVRGEIHNLLPQERRVPSVVIAVRDRSGANLFHTVAAVGSGLVSRGGFTRFTARIPSPPPGVASVAVHFPAPK
jgi:predicted Zn finger-like uncharacterized protein